MASLSLALCFIALLQLGSSLRTGKPLIDKINFFRCEMCAHQWSDSKAYPKCKVFMARLCNPGPDGRMDGSPGERTTGHGWCMEFFNRDPNADGPIVTSSGTGVQAAGSIGAAGASVAAGAPAAAGLAVPPQPIKPIDTNDLEADYSGTIWTRRMVDNGESIDGIDPSFIFGDKAQADYLSRREIKSMPTDDIVSTVEDVRDRFDKQMPLIQGQLEAVGPLPFDFSEVFSKAVSDAVPGCRPAMVKVISIPGQSSNDPEQMGDVRRVVYMAPVDVVKEVRHQAIDPNSRLVNGIFRKFLIAKSKFQRYSEEEHEFWMS